MIRRGPQRSPWRSRALLPYPEPLPYLLAPVVSALLLFGAAHLLGERLCRLLRLDLIHPLERVAIPGALGLGALGLAGMALGLAGGFRSYFILALLVVPVLAARIGAGPEPETPPLDADGAGAAVRTVAWCVVALLALANAARALDPPTGFDALGYQLPAVERYLQEGALTFPADLRFAAGPAIVPVLFVLAASTGGDLAAQLVSFGLGLLAAAAVGAVAGRAFGRTAGPCAMALFYATPIVGWLSSEAYVDLGVVLFTTVALHAVLVRLAGGGRRWLVVAAIAAGSGLGTRYLAIVPVAVLTIDLLSAPARGVAQGTFRRARAALLFLALTGAVAAPWYVRNLRESGNPVFPLFNDVLGGRLWSADDVSEHQAALEAVGPGRSATDLLLLPLRLTFEPSAFGASTGTGVGYAYLLVVPIALTMLGRWRAGTGLALYAAVCGLGWFATSQQPRFLLPSLAALAALGGMAIQEVALRRTAARQPLVGLFLLAALVATVGPGTRFPRGWPPAGAVARERYLQQHVPGYRIVDEVNRRLGKNAVLYAFGMEGLRYYLIPRTLGDWFGPQSYRRFLPSENDEEVMVRFRALGVTHVLIRDDVPSRAVRAFRERPYWWDRLVPLGAWEDARLYRLDDRFRPGEVLQGRREGTASGPLVRLTPDPAQP